MRFIKTALQNMVHDVKKVLKSVFSITALCILIFAFWGTGLFYVIVHYNQTLFFIYIATSAVVAWVTSIIIRTRKKIKDENLEILGTLKGDFNR